MQTKCYLWFACTLFVAAFTTLQAFRIEAPAKQIEQLEKNLTEEQKKQFLRDIQFSTHGVIFFIDTLVKNNNDDDAVILQLKMALEAQKAPENQNSLPQLEDKHITRIKRLVAVPIIVSSTIWHMFLQNTANQNAYQSDQWDAYKISDYFYLLMPKSYLNILPQGKAAGSFFTQDITSGFKLSTFKKLDSAAMLNPTNFISVKEFTKKFSNPAKKLSEFFIKTINKIFITNKEYITAGASSFIPRWAVLMIAHGMQYRFDQVIAQLEKNLEDPVGGFNPTAREKYNKKSSTEQELILNQTKKDITAELNQLLQERKQANSATSGGIVAGIELGDMRRLLDYFNTKITVPFVMLISCYAASTNMQKILSDTMTTQFLTPHKFFLFSGAIAASPVIVKKSDPYNFAQFFADLRQPGPVNFVETSRTIYAYYNSELAPRYNNSLMVKPPSAPWMYPALMPKKIGSIGRAMNVRTAPLNPTQFFGGPNNTAALDVLLFYTDRVAFPLVIEKGLNGKIPVFISMMPGDSVLKIEQIVAPNVSFSELVKAFLKLKELNDIKIFHISSLATQDYPQDSQANNSSVLQDVIIMSIPGRLSKDPTIKKVFFTKKADGKETFWEADLTKKSDVQATLKQVTNLNKATNLIDNIIKQPNQQERELFYTELQSLKKDLEDIIKPKIQAYQEEAAALKAIKKLGTGLASIRD